MEPGEQSELDQATATMVDSFCPMWRRMYTCFIEEGFTEIESFKLVQTHILSQAPNGIQGAGD